MYIWTVRTPADVIILSISRNHSLEILTLFHCYLRVLAVAIDRQVVWSLLRPCIGSAVRPHLYWTPSPIRSPACGTLQNNDI